jgi:hypothetical protein
LVPAHALSVDGGLTSMIGAKLTRSTDNSSSG